jgi:deoxyribodipyrimidine photo-lyase
MQKALVWVRRDLRLSDHTPLAHAAALADTVAVAFVFDRNILAALSRKDRRLTFIHKSLEDLDEELQKRGSRLIVRIGDPVEVIPKLAGELGTKLVCAGRDYEAYAKKRDTKVAEALKKQGAQLELLKDQVIFEGRELLSKTGTPFKVFTPYKNAWLAALAAGDYDERVTKKVRFTAKAPKNPDWSLSALGFEPQDLWLEAGEKAALKRLKEFEPKMKDYAKARDFPATEGSSGLSVHLRFGTVSIRACVRSALAQKNPGAVTWLSELIWRDFYQMILDNNPRVETGAFKKEYDSIEWPGSSRHFQAWCEGRTGYPLVDAAMRHFNATGWMHNRLRMVVASFLTKDLLVSWQRGEAYFAEHLLDFDLAANNGGWQWSASTGCDAQPYFRIFNPYSQSKKFDPDGTFIRENVRELRNVKGKAIHRPPAGASDYPDPIVDHSSQREKAIRLFKK